MVFSYLISSSLIESSFINEEETLKIIFVEELSKGIAFEDENFVIDDEVFSGSSILKIIENGFSLKADELVSLKIWYLQETDQYKVYVLQDVNMYSYDFFIIIIDNI